MLNAVLTERIEITPELLILRVKPDAEIPNFIPGQYVALGVSGLSPRPAHFPPEAEAPGDKIVKRAYSIGSSPIEKGYLEFYIAIVPEGVLTSRLVMLKPGDRLYAAPKITGTFTLDGLSDEANLVLVSTGTGLAPYMSMLRTPGVLLAGRKISVVHGVRYATDLAYADELRMLAQEYPDFSYHAVVSRDRPNQKWEGARGHVHTFFDNNIVATIPSKDHVFLCGNPAMIDSMETRLVALGYKEHSKKSPGDLHLERYW